MKIIYTFLTAVSVLFTVFSAYSATPVHAAFGDGEKLVYAVNYKVGIVNTDVAEVTFSTKKTQLNGREVFRITATALTHPFYKWFFDLHDTYVSHLDANTLEPIDLKVELIESRYRFSSYQKYDWVNMVVNSSWRNHNKSDTFTQNTMPLRQGSADAIAAFFNLRSVDISTFEPGVPRELYLVLEDTVRRMHYTFIGRETKTVRGVGKFKTLRFKVQIVTSTGESFKDGSEFHLWISDDRNRIPIHVETPIRVGSVRVSLLRYENLKCPLDSKL